MSQEAELSKEQQILRAMRKTLTSVVRDLAPRDGVPSPLAPDTVENIRMCLGLISAREAELAEALGLARNERPRYSDEPAASQTMEFVPPGRKLN
ncbi:MAG: segregation and condensation protein A [Pseudomonadota bacterium]